MSWSMYHTHRMIDSLKTLYQFQCDLIQNLNDLDSDTSDVEGLQLQITESLAKKNFRLAYTGIMKTGKSTALNAAMRYQALPADLLPETSSIVSIFHEFDSAIPVLKTLGGRVLAEGAENIFAFIKELNLFLRSNIPVSLCGKYDETMKLLNISARIAFLNEVQGNIGGVRFILMDTPGVNEPSKIIEDGTIEILSQADVLVYLFDIGKLSSRDEQVYFNQIVSQRPDLIKEGRAFFLLNKKDLIRGDIEETLREAKALIHNFLSAIDPELAVLANQILPVSTEYYFLAKVALMGRELNTEGHKTLVDILWGRSAPADVNFADERWTANLNSLIEDSEYEDIEAALRDKLTLNAPRMFTSAIIGKMNRIAAALHQQLQTRMQAFTISMEDTGKAIQRIEIALRGANTFHGDVEEIINNTRRDIIGALRPVLDATEQELRNSIALPKESKFQSQDQALAAEKEIIYKTKTGFTLCITKIQAVMRSIIIPLIARACKEIDRSREKTIRLLVVNSLNEVLSDDELRRLEESLMVDVDWNYTAALQPIGVELNMQNTTRSTMTQIAEERPYLVEAIYGSRTRTVGTPTSILAGATGGSTIGAAFGGLGALIGGALGAVTSLLDSKKKTTSTYEEQYVIQPAKLEFKIEMVNKEIFVINIDEIRQQMENFVVQLANDINNGAEAYIEQELDAIQTTVEKFFIMRLQDIVNTLQGDLNMRRANAEEASARNQQLLDVNEQLQNFLTNMKREPEEIISDPLNDRQ